MLTTGERPTGTYTLWSLRKAHRQARHAAHEATDEKETQKMLRCTIYNTSTRTDNSRAGDVHRAVVLQFQGQALHQVSVHPRLLEEVIQRVHCAVHQPLSLMVYGDGHV